MRIHPPNDKHHLWLLDVLFVLLFYKVDLNNAALVKNINFDTDLVSDITKEFIDIIGDSKTILIRLGKLIPPEELIKKAVTWGAAGLITAENEPS